MNLHELLANEELRQAEFPVAQNRIFLGHAGVCPLPRRVAQAIQACAAEAMLGDQEAFVIGNDRIGIWSSPALNLVYAAPDHHRPMVTK